MLDDAIFRPVVFPYILILLIHLHVGTIMFESIFKAVVVAIVTKVAEKIIEAVNE